MSPPPGRHHAGPDDRGWSPAEQPPTGPSGAYPVSGGPGSDWRGQPGPGPGPSAPPPPQWGTEGRGQWSPAGQPVAAAPPPAGRPGETTAIERAWVDLRLQVASRLRGVNAKHCQEAFDRLGRRNALGPHGVVLFYTVGDRQVPHGCRLLIATRLFLAGPESDDLPKVLHDLSRTAAGNIARAESRGQRWDPRGPEGSLINGGDPDMPRDAGYLGVGISTLDSEDGPWHAVADAVRRQPADMPRPRSVFDLAGEGIALLCDGTALRMVRNPRRRLGDDGFTSNKSLDASQRWPYNPYADLTEQGDQTLRAAWAQLGTLHRTLADHLLSGRTA
ncbi:hypothetical protein JD76_00753 [Micromonospora endolithica]|nr:hypothetical protein JD76_00753 [Micromonospora endolithica]